MGAYRIGEAVRELNDVLGLRDCAQEVKMAFSDQQELFQLSPRTPGCIRFEVKKCLGPCVAGCSSLEYAAQLALARAFLDGTSDEPLDALRPEDGGGERGARVRARRATGATSCAGWRGSASSSPGCASRWRRSRSSTASRGTPATTAAT
jgi:hypothetical protein